MARSSTKDPLDKFRWQVDIIAASSGNPDLMTRLGFTHVDAPGVTYSTREYPEGGRHLHPRQIIDGASYKPITLMRGVTSDLDFALWAQGPIQMTGAYANSSPFLTPSTLDYRRHVAIYHLDRTGQAIKIYVLFNAIPVEFSPASDFASDGDDAISLEKLVLKYESFKVISSSNSSNPLSPVDLVKQAIKNF